MPQPSHLALQRLDPARLGLGEIRLGAARLRGERSLFAGLDLLATGLNNLALLYHNQGQYANAEPLYQRALRILEAALPFDHPDLAQTMESYAALLGRLNRDDEAKAWQAEGGRRTGTTRGDQSWGGVRKERMAMALLKPITPLRAQSARRAICRAVREYEG